MSQGDRNHQKRPADQAYPMYPNYPSLSEIAATGNKSSSENRTQIMSRY
jgi:hypothetical protein